MLVAEEVIFRFSLLLDGCCGWWLLETCKLISEGCEVVSRDCSDADPTSRIVTPVNSYNLCEFYTYCIHIHVYSQKYYIHKFVTFGFLWIFFSLVVYSLFLSYFSFFPSTFWLAGHLNFSKGFKNSFQELFFKAVYLL